MLPHSAHSETAPGLHTATRILHFKLPILILWRRQLLTLNLHLMIWHVDICHPPKQLIGWKFSKILLPTAFIGSMNKSRKIIFFFLFFLLLLVYYCFICVLPYLINYSCVKIIFKLSNKRSSRKLSEVVFWVWCCWELLW